MNFLFFFLNCKLAIVRFVIKTCYNNLFDVQQLSTSPNVKIAFKSFRFTTDDGDNESQHQKVSCKLHLDPATKATETPIACTCFNQSDCDAMTNTGEFDSNVI